MFHYDISLRQYNYIDINKNQFFILIIKITQYIIILYEEFIEQRM